MKHFLLKLRFLLVPPASRREKAYHALRLGLLMLRQNGLVLGLRRWIDILGSQDPKKLAAARQKEAQQAIQKAAAAYAKWIQEHEPGPQELAQQRQASASFRYRPLITFLTPVYNPPIDVLRDTLESVLAQTYANWEFCLANASTDPAVQGVLDEYTAREPRIRPQRLEKNLGISGNSNAALRQAQGEYIMLLDHDDLLAPDLLFEAVQRLNADPSIDVLYYDEDKISADRSQRTYPWFKPTDWSPDLMLSTNVLMHSFIRRARILEVGEFDPVMDGAQDWDLSLRLTEKYDLNIVHMPRIFYHWRALPGSAASDANAKPWAFAAQQRCIEAHLARQGAAGARVEFPSLGRVRVIWPPSGKKVSIIIPTKDKVELLKECITSIFQLSTYPDYEVIVVDTGSTQPETHAYYHSLVGESRLRILYDTAPFNYHRVNNLGAAAATGEVLVFLNNDTRILERDWLEELAGWALRPTTGVVGAKLIRPDGTIQHAGIIMGLAGHGSHLFEGSAEEQYGIFGSTEWYRNLQAVTGACLAVRREVFEQLGGFDEIYRVSYGDIDLCLRARQAGYRVVYTPFARLVHHEGGTRGLAHPSSDTLRATLTMFDKIVNGDPYFNPNLSHWQRIPALPTEKEKSRRWLLLKILADFDLVWLGDPQADTEERWEVRRTPPSELPDPGDGRHMLVVSHELSRTGAPIILWDMCRFLKRQGYTISVVSPFEGPLRQSYEEEGIPVFVVPMLMEDARLIWPLLKAHDLLFANTILSFRLIHAAQALGKPSVWLVQEFTFGEKMAHNAPAVAQALDASQAVIFPCQSSARLYRPFSNHDNYFPMITGFGLKVGSAQEAPMAPLPWEKAPGQLWMLHVGSIETRKAQDVLLRALRRLPHTIRTQLETFMVGRILIKSEKSYCQQVLRTVENTPNVRLTDDLPHAQVRQLLELADIFVLPSRDEVMPLSIMEAMEHGKAIIATDVGGVAELIQDGVTGLLVKAEDDAALAQAIQRLSQDPTLRQRLGQAAQQTYQQRLAFPHASQAFYEVLEHARQPGQSSSSAHG